MAAVAGGNAVIDDSMKELAVRRTHETTLPKKNSSLAVSLL